MKITLWSMLSPRLQEALVPVSERAEREAAAQGLKGAAYQQQVRRARARWLAQGLEAQFSGRIDASLSTKSMDGYGALDAKDMRALRTELGIPFHWLRGAEFPVAFANIPQFMAQTRFWNDSDWVYFFTSSMVLDVRLKQRFPTQAELRRNDGAVSAASASAVGAPLTGNAATSTLPTNHDGLLFHPGVIKAVLDALRE